MIIQGLWVSKVDAIIGVKLGDADADNYKYKLMTALLDRWEIIKKDKHSKHCNDQQKHFLQFFLSVDRMLGREALVFLYQLSRVMEEKRK